MPRPRTKEEGGEAQWGKDELDKGAPVEQRGESLLDGGSEVSRSRHGFKAQSQVYELPAICSEAIEGSREGEGSLGCFSRRRHWLGACNVGSQARALYAKVV